MNLRFVLFIVDYRISLDYEKQSIYRIPLLVTDAGGRRAFSTLILNVVDENDNVPSFVASEYEMSVLADAEDGEAIFMVCISQHFRLSALF